MLIKLSNALISLLLCQPYVWHMAKSSALSVKNMQEYLTPEETVLPKLIKTHKHPPKGEQILILTQRNQAYNLQARIIS